MNAYYVALSTGVCVCGTWYYVLRLVRVVVHESAHMTYILQYYTYILHTCMWYLYVYCWCAACVSVVFVTPLLTPLAPTHGPSALNFVTRHNVCMLILFPSCCSFFEVHRTLQVQVKNDTTKEEKYCKIQTLLADP